MYTNKKKEKNKNESLKRDDPIDVPQTSGRLLMYVSCMYPRRYISVQVHCISRLFISVVADLLTEKTPHNSPYVGTIRNSENIIL